MYNSFPDNLYYWIRPSAKAIFTIQKSFAKFRNMFNSVEEGKGVHFYNEWVKDIRDSVPEDRLLLFNVKEGWAPLCKFLNVPIPNEPFPKVNSTANFQSRIRKMRTKALLGLFTITAIPIITAITLGNYF